MAWALTIIVVIGVGLPFAAWRLGRHVDAGRQPSVGGLGPPTDAVDKWLIDQHGLPAPQRWQVRDAVVYGHTVRDPALRPAAHDLAGCALRGELRLGRRIQIGSIVLMAEGAALIAIGIALLVMLGGPGDIVAVLIPFLLGAWYLARGVIVLRRIRGAARRAYQLNA
jgi:hypothetical protein